MSELPQSQNEVGKLRIKQVFEYLKALNDHRNPSVRQVKGHPWHLWLDDLPDHPTIELQAVHPQKARDTDEGEELTTPLYLFRVRRPKLTRSPSPSAELHDWLHAGWDDPENDARFHLSRNQVDLQGETVTVQFDDNPARPATFAPWQQKREKWRVAERPARQAMEVFEKLYALHGKLERESELFDLVVADGLLSWQRPEGSIYHPLLIQRVQLEFDSKVPEFRIIDADVGCELYTSLFQTISDVDPTMLAARRQELENGGYHPLSLESSAFLQGLVNHISPQGAFLDKGRPDQECEQPTVGRGPLLFLRSRTKGYGNAIEQVIKSIESREDFCDALVNIVGCETPRQDDEPANRDILHERDVLFGKEANQEQFRIAQQLNQHGSVLVQGPPGTGKSHTIANLIGHLLAHGQSVLVTSHTTKALRVLRDHVIENLRPLCVSVLESDLESREQLKQSVLRIASRLSQSNEQELECQAALLTRQRSDLSDAHERSREDLRKARTDEYREIVFGGTSFSPSNAARKVAAGRDLHDWIPGPVALGESLPLSAREIHELYATNASTYPEDDGLARRPLPPATFVLSPDEFSQALEAKQAGIDNRLWENVGSLIGKEQNIQELTQDFREAIAEFKRFDDWQLAAVDAGRDHAGLRRSWEELIQEIKELRELHAGYQPDFIKHYPVIVEVPTLEIQKKIAEEILVHLGNGRELRERKSFSFSRAIRKEWRVAYEAWRVNDRTPETVEEFVAIERLLSIKIKRAAIGKIWDRLMASNGGPAFADLGENPERGADQFAHQIAEALNWWNSHWSPAIKKLCAMGFNWDRFLSLQPFHKDGETLRSIVAVDKKLFAELRQLEKRVLRLEAQKKLESAFKQLEPFDRPEVVELRRAMQVRDAAGYQQARRKCLEATERQTTVLRRYELLGRLERRTSSGTPIAEGWAVSIRNRIGVHGKPEPPGDPAEAWNWRQLNDELDRRAKVDLAELGTRIASIRDDLRRTTNELIDQRAWAGQVRRTSLPQRQALMGWLDTVKRIGKGTGKRVPQLRREAQRLMEECRTAVPVWVMPLARLVESFDFSKQCFDVVIIDEASQCNVMALLALALAKKVIIVGDDEQVSPLAVGQKQDSVGHLIELHLHGIPNAMLYDGRVSIYDLAKQSFAGIICLLEHFRCVPDIIQFSNHLCYRGDIKPLREDSSSPIRPHVVSFRVEGICNSKVNVNREEAWTVAALVAAAIERPEYREMSFGVISLLGDNQAYEIEQILLKRLPPDEYQRRRIVCGNSAQFQGDERHVMFLSMVSSPEDTPLRLNDRKEFQQRLNVAASRARNQMWLVYSLDPNTDLKSGDLRRRLIEHVLDPRAVTQELERRLDRTQSPFERLVLGDLVRAGYRASPQWPVGSYRIDFVVEGGGKRLALECDGDRYHPLEKLPEDMERQAILERLGWRFIRIRGSAFFRDRERTMQDVFRKLEEVGIPPEGIQVPRASDEESLVSAIRRRASELRAAWQEELNAENQNVGGSAQPPGQGEVRRESGDKEDHAKRTSEGLADSQPATQATLFPVEEERPMPPELESETNPPPTATVPSESVAHEVEPRDEPDGNIKDSGGTAFVHPLLSILDRTIFPAVAGTEPPCLQTRSPGALAYCLGFL
jgi:very-short-patch-repair endonuclease